MEQGKAAAGAGFMSVEGLKVYQIGKPINDYHDAVATGRCAMHCKNLEGATLVIAVIYAWAGTKKGSV